MTITTSPVAAELADRQSPDAACHGERATAIAQQLLDVGQVRQGISIALRLGEHVAARRAACALLQHYPEAVTPLVLLGQALLDAGRPEAAIAQFARALGINPLDATAWAGLAGAHAALGQHHKAAEALERAALHDPLGSEMLAPGIAPAPSGQGVGVVYLRRGHAALAAAELTSALMLNPERGDLRLYLVEALRRGGERAGARSQFDQLPPELRQSLPSLLLHAALSDDPPTTAPCRQSERYDPDGHLTRQFFAPDGPPWQLRAVKVPREASFAEVLAFLPQPALPPAPHAAKRVDQPQADEAPVSPQLDTDVGAVIATTEQLRHRLLSVGGGTRPLVQPSSAPTAQVLLSNKAALLRAYGASGFAAIDERLHVLVEALRQRGVRAHCCYLDDAASLWLDDQLGFAPTSSSAPAIRELVRGMSGAIEERGWQVGPLLLIGGDEIVPFHRLSNPIADGDDAVLSDNPYGSDDAGFLLPQRIVARLPTDAGDSPAFLLTALQHMIDYHTGVYRESPDRFSLGALGQHLLRGRRVEPPAAAGYSAAVWQEPSRVVLDTFAADAALASSPPLDVETLNMEMLSARRLLYVNLHGARGLPNWYGQPDAVWPGPATNLPVALSPEHLSDSLHVGGLLISEACYGLDLAGRTPGSSIPLRALAEGASACVGATVNAYGSYTSPLIGADLLCQRLFAQLACGLPIGEALHQARFEFAQTMYRRQGYLDEADIKTLTEFVLLGDPWARASSAPARATSWPVAKLAGIERVPKPQPRIVLSEAQAPRAIMQRARAVLKRILPNAPRAPLAITLQVGPRLLSKGELAQEVVVSARSHIQTDDGYQLAQTALVTLNEHAVLKVALTR